MKLFVALLLIIFLAFSGYHLSFREFRLPVVARKFYLTGTEFIFLGLLLGPKFFNMFDADIVKGLDPLSGLILGWIGLLFGFQLELKKMRRFPLEYLWAASLEGIITLVFVLAVVWLLLTFFSGLDPIMIITVSLTLAAFGACTAQTGLALVRPDLISKRQKTASVLRYISSFDGYVALCFLGMAFLLHPPLAMGDSLAGIISCEILVGGGTALAFLVLYVLFLGARRNENELVLVMIGMAVLTSGAALVLNLSPLVLNFLMGVCLVNLSRQKELIFRILISVEKPVYVMLMVFLGIGWRIDSGWPFLLGSGFCALRFIGKLSGGAAIRWLVPGMKQMPRYLGFGLLDSGGLSLAILLDYQRGFAGDISSIVVGIAIVSVIFSDVLSTYFLLRLFKRES